MIGGKAPSTRCAKRRGASRAGLSPRASANVATGEQDAGSHTRMAKFMHAQIAGSQLEILPRLRHSILVEAPELVTQLVRGFLL